jgi:hypothetical protein
MMIALKAAKSAVFMALHSVSVTILVVKPREAASSISRPVRFSTKRRSSAKAETVGVGVVGMLVEFIPVGDGTKDVLSGGADTDTVTTETKMPLGVEVGAVAEHCEETTLSPQVHSRTQKHSD